MEISAVLLTLVFTALFTVIIIFISRTFMYNYMETPPVKMSKCPTRWNFNSSTNMCEPSYETGCLPFNPDVDTLKTVAQKCALANHCATDWSGVCN